MTVASGVTTKALDRFTPLDADVLRCPHEYNSRMRGEAPIYRCPHTGMFFVFDYATNPAYRRRPRGVLEQVRRRDAARR